MTKKPASKEKKICTACGEPGATYASVLVPGGWLCKDPRACLERVDKKHGWNFSEIVTLR